MRVVASVVFIVIADTLVLERERRGIGPIVHHPFPEDTVVDEGINAVGVGKIETLGDPTFDSLRETLP